MLSVTAVNDMPMGKCGVAWTDSGQTGGALQFDGVNDYVSAVIDVSETAYSVSLWFKTDSPDSGLFSVTDGELGARGSDRHVYLTGGNLASRIWNNETIQTSGLNLADGQWHHVVHTYGGSQGGQKLFVDGVMQASGSKSQSDFTSQDRIQIGFSGVASSRFFAGTIDEVRVYDRALSNNEIATLAGAAPLLAAGGPVVASAHTPALSTADLTPLVDHAIAAWAAVGINDHQLDLLHSVQVKVSDLPSARLGQAFGNTITVDINAAGYGWFIDSTPSLNEEFGPLATQGLKADDGPASDRIDLLSVVFHELGHVIGLDDDYSDTPPDDIMNSWLPTGTRRLPSNAAIDALLSDGEQIENLISDGA